MAARDKKNYWFFIIAILIAVTAWFFLFYKTYTEKYVAHDADQIISIDIKKITNTAIWQLITTPSQWKKSSSSGDSKKNKLKKLVKLPDYIFIFHKTGQPINAWYSVLPVKNPGDFDQQAAALHFKNIPGSQRFVSDSLGIEFIKSGNQLLLGNALVADKNLIEQTAKELFVEEKHITRNRLNQLMITSAHVSWQAFENGSWKEAAGTINFDKKSVNALATITLTEETGFEQKSFSYPDSAFISVGAMQPPQAIYKLIPETLKERISHLFNFSIDTLLLSNANYYQLQVSRFTQKEDTAISYTYDDDFNPVEKKVINKTTEPDFSFNINSSNPEEIYQFWKRSGILDTTDQGVLFTPMPFVKTYLKTDLASNQLLAQSVGYNSPPAKDSTIPCMAFTTIHPQLLPDSIANYFPQSMGPFFKKLGLISLLANSPKPGTISVGIKLILKEDESWLD